jgi:hypothetical protein
MHRRWMTLTALATLASSPLLAQRTADQARLSLGLAFGVTSGTDLWRVPNQPIFGGLSLVDTLDIGRRIRPSLAVIFHGTYFPGEHWGITGEAMLIGLGFEDDCEVKFFSGSVSDTEVCNSINGTNTPASAAALSIGTEYRIRSHQTVSPYLRAHVGLVMTQHSPLKMDGTFTTTDTTSGITTVVLYRLYDDPKQRRIRPVFGLGVGFTALMGRGYQLRIEGRDNITGTERVTGPTFGAPFLVPPSKTVYKHIFSVTFGFDVVLERRRGRRY